MKQTEWGISSGNILVIRSIIYSAIHSNEKTIKKTILKLRENDLLGAQDIADFLQSVLENIEQYKKEYFPIFENEKSFFLKNDNFDFLFKKGTIESWIPRNLKLPI